MVDTSIVKDFGEFKKKKNNLLLSFLVYDVILLLILMSALCWVFSFVDEPMQTRYILYCVCGYLVLLWCIFPLVLKMIAYSVFCNIIYSTQKHRDLVQKRTDLIKDIIEKNNLDDTKITEFFDSNEYDTQQPVLKSKDFEIEDVIKSWINDNINHLKMKEKSSLKSIQYKCYMNLALYVSSVLYFCKKYDKNIKAKRFDESLIPPMLFDEADIAFFNKAEKTYYK